LLFTVFTLRRGKNETVNSTMNGLNAHFVWIIPASVNGVHEE